jgi:hypothetical protein
VPDVGARDRQHLAVERQSGFLWNAQPSSARQGGQPMQDSGSPVQIHQRWRGRKPDPNQSQKDLGGAGTSGSRMLKEVGR